MNHTKKVVLIVAGALVLIGILLALLALGMGGFRLDHLGSDFPYERKRYTFAETELRGLAINNVADDILVYPSSTGEIEVECYENDHAYYKVELGADGVLRVDYEEGEWQKGFGLHFNSEEHVLRIAIPPTVTGKGEISTVSADMQLQDIRFEDGFSASTTSGELELAHMASGASVTIHTVSGDLLLDGAEIDGDFSVETVSGELECNDVRVSGWLRMDNTSGEIDFRNLAAEAFEIDSISGNIYGVVLGAASDYDIQADSVSGNLDIARKTGGQKPFQISTTSGNIRIDFVENMENIEGIE